MLDIYWSPKKRLYSERYLYRKDTGEQIGEVYYEDYIGHGWYVRGLGKYFDTMENAMKAAEIYINETT